MKLHRGGAVVVIGGSAGAVDPLRLICAGLAPGFPAAILVVMHLSPALPSSLARILAGSGPLPAAQACGGQEPVSGQILVAPPDHHLLVAPDGRIELSTQPHESGFRPSIDALFRSAAEVCGKATTGVVLSGALSDGVAGAAEISEAGGTVVVQDPADAILDILPRSALRANGRSIVVPSVDIAATLRCLVTGASNSQPARPKSRWEGDGMTAGGHRESQIDPTNDVIRAVRGGF